MSDEITIVFAKSNLIGAYLIRMITWSNWSHCGIYDPSTNTILEAEMFSGVAETPLDKFKQRYAKGELVFVKLACKDSGAIIKAAREQLGKPYDYLGVLGIAFHREWSDDNKWWCSEYVAGACEMANDPLFRKEALKRVTPQHLWILNPIR